MAAAPTSRYHQLTLEIEHCVDCEEHLHTTHHDARKYEDYAKKVQNAVLAAMPDRLNILINPKPDLGRKGQLQFQEDPYSHHFYVARDLAGVIIRKFRYPQLGSFEVYLHNPFVNQKLCVFSKLTVGKWPNADIVAGRIQRALGAGPSVSFFLFNERQPSASASRLKSRESKVAGPAAILKGKRGQPPRTRLPGLPTSLRKAVSSNTLQGESPDPIGLPESSPSEAAATQGPLLSAIETDLQKPPSSASATATPPTEAEDPPSEKEGKKKKKKKDKLQSSSSTVAEEGDLSAPSDEGSPKKKKKNKNKKKKDGGGDNTASDDGRSGGADSESASDKKKKKKKKKGDGHDTDVSHSDTEQSAASKEDKHTGGQKKSKTKQASSDNVAETDEAKGVAKQSSSHSLEHAITSADGRGHKKSKKKRDGASSSPSFEKVDSGGERTKASKSPSSEITGSPAPEENDGPVDAGATGRGQEAAHTADDTDKTKEGEENAGVAAHSDSHPVESEEGHGKQKKEKKKKGKEADADSHKNKEKEAQDGEKRHKEGKKKKDSERDTKEAGGKKRTESSDALDKKKGKKRDKGKDNMDSPSSEAIDERQAEGEEATKDDSEASPPSAVEEKEKKKKKGETVDGGSDGENKRKKKDGERTSEDLGSENPKTKSEKDGNPVSLATTASYGGHPLAPVTKQYDLTLPVGAKKTQKLSYENPGDQPRNFRLVSSDSKAMEIKSPEVTVEPKGKVKIGLIFSEVLMPTEATYYLYIYDKDTEELQECVQIKGTYIVA